MAMDLGIEDMSITEDQEKELEKYGLKEDEEQVTIEEQQEDEEVKRQEMQRQEIQNYLDNQNQEVMDEYVKVQATDYAGRLEEINNQLDSINIHDPSVRDEVKEQLLQIREELTKGKELEEDQKKL